MAVKNPNLSDITASARLADQLQTALAEGDSIEGLSFEGDYLEDVEGVVLDFNRCLFRHVTFCPCNIERIHLTDCRFEMCDLSGFQLREGTMRRVCLEDCRCAGSVFSHMSLRDARFLRCQLSYACFVDSKLQDVSFEECQMNHTLLHGCTQKALSLVGCDMVQSEIIETSMGGVDLSSCSIDGLRTSIKWLEGAAISLAQSPVVLGLCGIQLK